MQFFKLCFSNIASTYHYALRYYKAFTLIQENITCHEQKVSGTFLNKLTHSSRPLSSKERI